MCDIPDKDTDQQQVDDAKADADNTMHTTTDQITMESKRDMPWPEEAHTSWLHQVYLRLTYSYVTPILRKGARQKLADGTHLSQEDLFRVPKAMESKFLSQKFEERYEQELQRGRGGGELLRALYHMAAPSFVPAGFCELITVLCQVGNPLLVRELLRILEEYPAQAIVKQGMPYAFAVFAVLVVNAFANHRHRYLATQSGILLRSTIVSVVYNRVLQLSSVGRQGMASGEVTNIVAIDTQKLFEVTQEAHLIWAMPLSIVLVTICLYLVLGPTTLIGVVVLILMVPAVERISSGMLRIRHQRVKLTDKRVEISNAMIQGIKVTKLNNYEKNYEDRVDKARAAELAKLRKELFVWALSLVLTVSSPMLATAATFVVYALVDESNILTASETFAVLLLFNALRFPINYFGRLMGRAAQALASIDRIKKFLQRQTRHALEEQQTRISGSTPKHKTSSTVLHVADASFRIGSVTDETAFEVANVNFTLQRGEILALCGPVGCGKSTLANGIISEVPVSPEATISMVKGGKVAFISQTAFILNATLRKNILFGESFEQEWYEKVLDLCCLWPDIKLLGEAGDLTEIGERGVTLSGGQKQRVSLARSLYARPDLVIADDPLSALDASTAKTIFDNLRKHLPNSGVVLVTHAAHFLSRVDRIMVISEGNIRFHGTWAELSKFVPAEEKTRDAVDHIRSSVQEGNDEDNAVLKREYNSSTADVGSGRASTVTSGGKLMTVEERKHGLSSISTWLLWFKYAGGAPFLLLHIFLMTADRFTYVMVEYWLARWTEGAYEELVVFGISFAPQSDGRSAQAYYVLVYGLLIAASVITTFCRSEWVVTGGSRAARRVFQSMLSRVLHAPMSYFETTPMGRVLNRFTYDMEVVDMTLTEAMSVLMIASGWFVAAIVVMCTIVPWMACAVFPIIFLYWSLMLHYRKSATDLQRLDAVARSPIQAQLAEAIEGNATIRVFEQEKMFMKRFLSTSDASASALINFISAQRWLGLRIELLGSIIVLTASVLVITLNGVLELEPGIVALLILWSSNFTITLGFLVDGFAEAEAAITSIERVSAMAHVPQEKAMETTKNVLIASSWPDQGSLTFENVCMRYRPGLPRVLNELTFTLPPRKRCGIVGRTGAGKSSLTAALFRLVELESGRIILDGVDLGLLGLADVRGRKNGMAIIPQDPFLAGTTLRECLDPFGAAKDEDILAALVDVRLAKPEDEVTVLNTKIEEGGFNYSVGERQLLNLARAILLEPRVLVLDEATASIDGETDTFIQRMLRSKFKSTSLLVVAHRLNTIMDYDMVLVMDGGKVAEMGSPKDLLSRNGLFSELVSATGVQSAKALRAMADAAP